MTDHTFVDEIELFGRIRARDQHALSELYQHYGGLVYSLALRILQNAVFAEEVTQDIFLKIWDQPHHWEPARGRLISWLLTVTRYTAIDRLRKEKRQSSWAAQALEDVWNLAAKREVMDDPKWHDGLLLRSLMNRLPGQQSELIELAFFGGMSHSEIAQQLGLPLGTVKTRIRLGLQKLKELWLEATEQQNSQL
jgi:RNA polymerase sigma-70 factor (ECF subfamily)